ncbi:MAG TPA: hypothetical protein VFI33_17830, partial [Puia sp.]|nr:hypothetical protein [Puia sp.]
MIKNTCVNQFLILIFILSISCNYFKKQSIISNNTYVEEIDTSKPILVTSYPGKVFPVLFEAAFINGSEATQRNTSFRFFKYDLGRIKVESGKMIACDPIVMHDASPF